MNTAQEMLNEWVENRIKRERDLSARDGRWRDVGRLDVALGRIWSRKSSPSEVPRVARARRKGRDSGGQVTKGEA
jgi:hypothetical protein